MLQEIHSGCAAALALAGGNTGPVSRLTDFWRSFRAAIVAYPLALLALATAPLEFEVTTKLVVAETIGYVAAWVAFPLVMVYLADRMGAFTNYWRYIIATNWANLLQGAAVAVVILLDAPGFLPQPVTAMLFMGVWFWILLFKWRLARHGLGIEGFPAAGIVLLDLALRLFLARFTLWIGS